jgi:hypothetical protein
MSAEIIPFGKAKATALKPKRAGRRRRTIKSDVQYDDPLARKIHAEAEQAKIRNEAVSVRCAVDGGLYEVYFRGANAWEIYSVNHRHQNGGVAEIKRRLWTAAVGMYRYERPGGLDHIVAAARRERSRNDPSRASRLNREASIAQLWARHARLLREAERVKTLIAVMEREVG